MIFITKAYLPRTDTGIFSLTTLNVLQTTFCAATLYITEDLTWQPFMYFLSCGTETRGYGDAHTRYISFR